MDIEVGSSSIVVRMPHREARGLCVAVAEGYEGLSRAEYFIRTGLSQPAVIDLIQRFLNALDDRQGEVHLSLEAGIEEMENPRRPGPAQ